MRVAVATRGRASASAAAAGSGPRRRLGAILVAQLAESRGVEHDGEANVVWCEFKRR